MGSTMGETDAVLVNKVKRGDSRAFDRLVRRHLRVAHAVASARLDNPSDADDVVQDAFIKALTSIDSCRNPERFRSWLLTIVKNTAHNRRAYNRVRDTAPLEHADGVSSKDDPLEDVRRAQLGERLTGAMGGLTDLQRRVLILHDMEGWKHAEIGSELGISAGSSRVHLHMARRAMRRILSNSFALGSL